jgi:hypothetical protein
MGSARKRPGPSRKPRAEFPVRGGRGGLGWVDWADSIECDSVALRRLQAQIEQREQERVAAFRQADSEGDE